MLDLLGLDMRTLRLKFGRQALRGKEPEVDIKEHTKVDCDDEDEDEGEKIVELEAESEEEWVRKVRLIYILPDDLKDADEDFFQASDTRTASQVAG